MNFEAYKQFCRELLASERGARLVRLDCMNPPKALSALAPKLPEAPPVRDAQELERAWREAFGLPGTGPQPEARVLLGRGVRDLLRALFQRFAQEGRVLHAPSDVYPVYHSLAASAGLRVHSFPTCPEPQLPTQALGTSPEVLLLPEPLVPLGRVLSDTEVRTLEAWLGADPRRLLVLDAVYTFAPRFTEATQRLLRTGQALLVHSLAKGHLAPDLAGFALVPGTVARGVEGFEAPQLEPLALRQACFLLEHHRELPARVQARFEEQWSRVRETLGSPPFAIPRTGYFTTSALSFEELLERGWLAVPGSVFGPPEARWSAVTCLLG
jgi:histidinol-phosphate/aromatic aminotransferase/cobyric acid decarboxylase-like protein